MKLYPFQSAAVALGVQHLKQNAGDPDAKLLIASPTGTGKSFMEREIQRQIPGCWIVTPVAEVIAGLLEKAGVSPPTGIEALHRAAESRRITTPLRLRNRMAAGKHSAMSAILWDEGHHQIAESWLQCDLMAGAPSLNFTATPYRGTPGGTQKFRDMWGYPTWAITYPEAFEQGYLHMPECRTVPLVDDDLVTIKGGEFEVEAVNAASLSRIEDLADLCPWPLDRPTMYALPSSEICGLLGAALAHRKIAHHIITQATTHKQRQKAFVDCIAKNAVLLQIRVVGEGVDLRIRRIIDASPAVSPVRFVQLFGRSTRPLVDETLPSEYICTNRNILRHGYLLDGCLPASVLLDGQAAFGGFGSRIGSRAIGLENLGRFKATAVPLADGLQGECYCISASEGLTRREYAAILHPASADPIWATRVNAEGSYGKWSACGAPEGLSGFASVNGSAPSEKQMAWWKSAAPTYGLDPEAKVNRRNFQVLPILTDLRIRMKKYGQ